MSEGIRLCKKCGFILGTKPGLLEKDGICQACINHEKKKTIDYKKNQKWLTQYLAALPKKGKYDCAIAVSGGKDSHMIVQRLMDNHGIKNPLLISLVDEFTLTKAGKHNRDNICKHFGVDHILFRFNPDDFFEHTLHDFETNLHPLKWFEEKIYSQTFEIAKQFEISTLFLGEDGSFEYGLSEDINLFTSLSDETTKGIFFGALYPYSTQDSLAVARQSGFKDLTDFREWSRQGNIEQYTQIDSIGYLVHIWCKFPKFGFQRVSDIACRHVREGLLSKKQAENLIRDRDYILDPASKQDFCSTLGITEQHFDDVVAKQYNSHILHYDCNNNLRRNDLCAF